MTDGSLLFSKEVAINQNIKIIIPTIGEIIGKGVDNYYSIATLLTAAPIDLMVLLDDMGIDFTTIGDYQLFLMMFAYIKEQDTSLFFGDLNISGFKQAENSENGTIVLYDEANNIVIDESVHWLMADTLRRINHFERNYHKPGNEAAREYMIERARIKMKRRKDKTKDSDLASLIVAMVNSEQYKFDFEGTKNLTIYQFNECVKQVIKKNDYNNKMYGIYAGTISAKELDRNDLNWLIHK